jgi:hypothetical protein
MRMHHHQGRGLPGHGHLVCQPPYPRRNRLGHGSTTHDATIIALWSTLLHREASGVMVVTWPTTHRWLSSPHHIRYGQHGWAWRAPLAATPGALGHWSWRPHAPYYRRCTRSGRSGPPPLPGPRAPPLLRWCRPTHTFPACHAIGNTPAPAIHPGPPPPGLVPDRPLPAPPGTRAGAVPRPG